MAKQAAPQVEVEVQDAEAPVAPVAEVVPVQPEPTIVAPLTKRARVKGTWTQYYANRKYDFVDGEYYDLPTDLFDYLRQRGCIYDTMV